MKIHFLEVNKPTILKMQEFKNSKYFQFSPLHHFYVLLRHVDSGHTVLHVFDRTLENVPKHIWISSDGLNLELNTGNG